MVTWLSVAGHRAVCLENDRLRVVVLPDKGADIYALVHKPSGVDALMKAPWGLHPPSSRPASDFLENYEGAWQELFPNANEACEVQGRPIPFHGEVALLPWTIECMEEATSALELSVETRSLPLRLRRRMVLRPGAPSLDLEETVTNLAPGPTEFVWGHHLVLGAPFLEAGCELQVSARALATPDEVYEPATAQLAAGQRGSWPWARPARGKEPVDLRLILGPEAHTHDDVYLEDLDHGFWRVVNPRLALSFTLEWDAAVFRSVTLWRPFGGSDLPPLTGLYGVGIEPWVSRYNLAQSMERGVALRLEVGGTLTTHLRATYETSPVD